MIMQEIKNYLTPKVLVSVGSLLTMLVSSVIVIDTRYAHAEDVERTTARIALDAQESLIQFRLDSTNREIKRLKRLRAKGIFDEEDDEDLIDLRKEKSYLNSRRDVIRDEIRTLQDL